MVLSRSNKPLDKKSIWDELLLSQILSKIHMRKLWRYLIENNNNIQSLDDFRMSDSHFSIPVKSEAKIKSEGFMLFTSKIIERIGSSKDPTIKLLIELQDGFIIRLLLYNKLKLYFLLLSIHLLLLLPLGHKIESVIIKHRYYSTLCVSSQIGCAMGCRFCATGTMV